MNSGWPLQLPFLLQILEPQLATTRDRVKISMDESATTVSQGTIYEGISTAQRRRQILTRVFLLVAKRGMDTRNLFTLLTQIPLLQSTTRGSTSVNTVSANELVGRDSSTICMVLRSIPLEAKSPLKITRP